MDYKIPLFVALSSLCLLHLLVLCFSSKQKWSKLPPGPKPVPIFGNIFQLSGGSPHRSLAKLSKMYGPLMSLKLGTIRMVVVTSVDISREFFQTHDKSFTARGIPDATRALDHHAYSMAWLPVSPKWRTLRKISSFHLFTKQKLDVTQLLRQKKVRELLEYVDECCRNGEAVEICRAGFTTSLNLLSNTLFSIDLASHNSASSQEFMALCRALVGVLGKPNLVDFFPILRYFDPSGIRREAEVYSRRLFAIFYDIIRQRQRVDPSSVSTQNDVLATLLKISNENASDLNLDDIKHLLFDLFLAGTETSSISLEWTMSELVRNPKMMAKVQAEMDKVLGNNEVVRESDIERLPYLQAVVKETLRLHTPSPFLIPRISENEVSLCGYTIPRNTQLMVNIWAMGRDPITWKNPEMFDPERFMGSEIDVRGQHFELTPFGAGSRMCPGMTLGYRILHLMLGNLVRSFNWKLEGGVKGEDLDMTDKFEMSLHKANPLLVIPLLK